MSIHSQNPASHPHIARHAASLSCTVLDVIRRQNVYELMVNWLLRLRSMELARDIFLRAQGDFSWAISIIVQVMNESFGRHGHRIHRSNPAVGLALGLD